MRYWLACFLCTELKTTTTNHIYDFAIADVKKEKKRNEKFLTFHTHTHTLTPLFSFRSFFSCISLAVFFPFYFSVFIFNWCKTKTKCLKLYLKWHFLLWLLLLYVHCCSKWKKKKRNITLQMNGIRSVFCMCYKLPHYVNYTSFFFFFLHAHF